MNPAAVSTAPHIAPRKPWAIAVALFALMWFALFNHLRVEWSLNPQYSYGWGVPFLAAYLFLRRWHDRPTPAPPVIGGPTALLFGAIAILLLPASLFLEANPDWRLVNWAAAILITLLCLGGLWFAGGRPWLKHFALPVAFLLLAVPWPSGLEARLIQGLMRTVASITVEMLNFLGVLASRRGNLIELPTGIVGINEACSGVRSFQSTVMISIFLGELYRFTLARRAALLGSGVMLAFLFNVGRSIFLTMMCVRGGIPAVDSWHDGAGYAVFGLSFAGLLGICFWLRRKSAEPADEPAAPATPPRPFPTRFLAVATAWLALVGIGTEGWYRLHELDARAAQGWSVAWPERAPQFKVQPIAEETRRILRFNDGSSASWIEPDGTQWLGFFFRWEPGRGSTQLARSHVPEVCMPASGLTLVAEHGMDPVRAGGIPIPFRAYTFSKGPSSVFIFFCVWEDQQLGEAPDLGRQRATPAARARAVLEGRRHLGQQVLQIVIAGPASIDEARRRVASELQQLVRPAPARG